MKICWRTFFGSVEFQKAWFHILFRKLGHNFANNSTRLDQILGKKNFSERSFGSWNFRTFYSQKSQGTCKELNAEFKTFERSHFVTVYYTVTQFTKQCLIVSNY